MSGFSTFRRTSWDPILIISQIITLQCFGYGTFSATIVFGSLLTNIQLSPSLLFSSTRLRGDTVEGWVIFGGWLVVGLMNIAPLVYMVERSRLCIDFSLTFYFVHLVAVWWYQGAPPETLLWWLAIAASGSLMAFGGRTACMHRELLPIAIKNFLPVHSNTPRAGPADEEFELETRPQPVQDREVLFDATNQVDAQSDHEDDGSWSDDDWGEDDVESEKLPSIVQPPQTHDSTPFATASHTPVPRSRPDTPGVTSAPARPTKGDKEL